VLTRLLTCTEAPVEKAKDAEKKKGEAEAEMDIE
jgi:hypothetical protein